MSAKDAWKTKREEDMTEEDHQQRIKERGNCDYLIGAAKGFDKDGNPVPWLDEDGNEILGIATGEDYERVMREWEGKEVPPLNGRDTCPNCGGTNLNVAGDVHYCRDCGITADYS